MGRKGNQLEIVKEIKNLTIQSNDISTKIRRMKSEQYNFLGF